MKKFIELTGYKDGKKLLVNIEHIQIMYEDINDDRQDSQTALCIEGQCLGVKETYEEICAMLEID
jgi:hypothetical protein